MNARILYDNILDSQTARMIVFIFYSMVEARLRENYGLPIFMGFRVILSHPRTMTLFLYAKLYSIRLIPAE